MRKLIVLILILLIPQQAGAQSFKMPPLKENPDEEQILIIESDKPVQPAQIKKVLKQHPKITLRHIFSEVLNGYSIKGPKAEMAKFIDSRPNTNALTTFKAQTYTVKRDSTIPFVGAEKARGYFDKNEKRLTGEGVKVGIIDTGMDLHHRDLERNFKGGKDVVDGDEEPMETQSSQGYATLHGTHVAGIIGANGSLQGMAPNADLYIYRALGPGGRGSTDQVLAAIEAAVKDKVDILNLSLGSEVNGPDLPLSKALDKVAEKGILPVVASGNSGPGDWTIGTPATSAKALAVGASTPPTEVPYLAIGKERIRLLSIDKTEKWRKKRNIELFDGGLGSPEELNGSSGKIAMIQRGHLTFEEKINNAETAGAKGVILYNNTKGLFAAMIQAEKRIPGAVLSMEEGQKLLKAKKPVSITVKMEQDMLAPFSSKGPVTLNWSIKPDLTAPGVDINSTIPGGYMSLQGTSMAAPHVSGAAAILKQAHPDWKAAELKAALMLTSKVIANENGIPYKVYEQGSGRIQVDQALELDTFVFPATISMGGLENNKKKFLEKQLTIKNTGSETKSYFMKAAGTQNPLRWELPLSFDLDPGEKKTVTVRAVIKNFPKEHALWEGRLLLVEGSREFSLPYLIAAGTPDYPRIMGFAAVPGDAPNTLRYEAYLPGGAEEFALALYDQETLQMLEILEQRRQAGHGMISDQIELPPSIKGRTFYAVAFVRESGEEDYQKNLIEWYR
ncbi:peptidase S8 [Bacillus salacetis]|uniref:Peptidase S8 n=1 Tax=Bacillus salacetis TaxID=2315464 RepID=A0A3A1R8J0_9BACI|nr:S8 family serine peptidase [Bacillus salacetis]RIW36131.1 peptidase S8 [Bacillus salacetis]